MGSCGGGIALIFQLWRCFPLKNSLSTYTKIGYAAISVIK